MGGLYHADLLNYPDWNNIPFDGTYWFTAKGTAEQPIVIEAAGDGEVIFDGKGLPTYLMLWPLITIFSRGLPSGMPIGFLMQAGNTWLEQVI